MTHNLCINSSISALHAAEATATALLKLQREQREKMLERKQLWDEVMREGRKEKGKPQPPALGGMKEIIQLSGGGGDYKNKEKKGKERGVRFEGDVSPSSHSAPSTPPSFPPSLPPFTPPYELRGQRGGRAAKRGGRRGDMEREVEEDDRQDRIEREGQREKRRVKPRENEVNVEIENRSPEKEIKGVSVWVETTLDTDAGERKLQVMKKNLYFKI